MWEVSYFFMPGMMLFWVYTKAKLCMPEEGVCKFKMLWSNGNVHDWAI